MKDKWMPVVGYEGLYEVSNTGKVRGLSNKFFKKERVFGLGNRGYYQLPISKNGKQSMKMVHRLVAEAFIPNVDKKPFINHKNGVKTDNRVENLEWCTRSENALHAFKIGLMKPITYWWGKTNEMNPASRAVIQKSKDGEIIKTYPSIRQAERELNNDRRSNISNVLRGVNKHCLGYKWEYA